MKKFQDRFRIASSRAVWWDYSTDGIYFITICTAGDGHYFGQIVNAVMGLSDIGQIVEEEWKKSFEIRKELTCDLYVIMPNHIHAILRIEKGSGNDNNTMNSDNSGDPHSRIAGLWENSIGAMQDGCRDARPCVSTGNTNPHNPQKHGVAMRLPKSISSFVAGFKSIVTIRARVINGQFSWQPRLLRLHNPKYGRI